ncbi:MAG: STY0301 family protein [Candidatus Korobacteraceae bacterium]
MTPRLIRLLPICIVLGGAIGWAAEPINCPDTVEARQQLTSSAPGWTAMLDDAPHSLAGVTFYDGLPSEKASLVYGQITRGKGEQTATWRFAPQTNRRIWVACSYAGTAIELTRSLPSDAKTCSVTYDTQQHIAGLPVIRKIACR